VRLEGQTKTASKSSASVSAVGSASQFSVRVGLDAPVRTRALPLDDDGVVAWQERLILALPMRKGEAGLWHSLSVDYTCLLAAGCAATAARVSSRKVRRCRLEVTLQSDAPSPHALAGVREQGLVLEVHDAAANGGRGATLGTARLAVPVASLQHREEHAAEVSWEAGQQQGKLQLSYMLQHQWTFAKASATQPQQDWSTTNADSSTAGEELHPHMI
jgi:hypothetical protein